MGRVVLEHFEKGDGKAEKEDGERGESVERGGKKEKRKKSSSSLIISLRPDPTMMMSTC